MTKNVSPLGQPISRVDGRHKVTGGAKYAGDFPLKNLAYGVLLQSTIASGSIKSVDTADAEKLPGVLAVITHVNASKLDCSKTSPFDHDFPILQNGDIKHDRQNIGVVVATSLEAAQEAAHAVKITYTKKTTEVDFWDTNGTANQIKPVDNPGHGMMADTSRGDFASAYASAPVKIDVSYDIPKESHNPLEPHATTALWDGPKLTVYDSTQGIFGVQQKLAKVFGIPTTDVRVVTKFVGGGFGSKGSTWSHVVIAALAAKRVGRPVQLVLDRSQTYGPVGWRPATKQHYQIGADSSGKLVAMRCEGVIETCQYDQFVEYVGSPTRFLYSCPNVEVTHRLVRQDIGKPTFMRAPGESTGTYGLGCAMDELANALNIDPVKLRLINYAETDEDKNLPYSSKHLKECYEKGAELFKWNQRNPKPGSTRRGNLLVGTGFATATYPAHQFPSVAKVILQSSGNFVVESGSQDIGTGTYTIMTQIAADSLSVPFERVKFQLGDTDYPFASVSGGSTTAVSVGNAIKSASITVLKNLTDLAIKDPNSPLASLPAEKITAVDGNLVSSDDPSRVDSYAAILKRANLPQIEAEGKNDTPVGKFSLHSFGAQFAEVEVDPDLKTVRVSRYLGVFDCGKVFNSKTARSQFMGGIIMGIGMALREHTILDNKSGRVLNADLAEYHLPVNADIPDLQIEWLEHPDTNFNPLGGRGVGEIGITGVAAAIANAIFHATGVRVRDLPITLDKLFV